MTTARGDTHKSDIEISNNHDKIIAANVALVAATIAQGPPGDEDIMDAYRVYKKILNALRGDE